MIGASKPSFSLPFAEQAQVRVMQGFNGPFSHKRNRNLDHRYALDFGLPLGTEVVAAARGRIYKAIKDPCNVYRGLSQREAREVLGGIVTTNQVVLVHPELGLSTRYSHLDRESICVDDGQIVEAGQKIGETGLSGWVGPVPHLHFHAETLLKGKLPSGRTIPFYVEGYDGPYDHLELMAALKATGMRWQEYFADLLAA